MDSQEYFKYLQQRSRFGLLYRRFFLYPILCRHLSGLTLDVGCGIGDMLQFRKNTIGVDINSNNVQWCHSKGLNAVLIKNNQLPFQDGAFNSAIMDNVLEHILDPTELLSEIHRVLEDGAAFLVGVPGKLGFIKDQDHKTFYGDKKLKRRLLQSNFSFVRLFYTPFKSHWVEQKMPQYCLYGVFQKK